MSDHPPVDMPNPGPVLGERIGAHGLLVDYTPVPRARGVVVFGHAGGSGRSSPRNRLVAGVLHDYGLSTLMVDLLPEQEPEQEHRMFAVALLADRMIEAMDWLHAHDPAAAERVGLLGTGTCGAAALHVAAQCPHRIAAVVTRGGRPDLVLDRLGAVRAPTLLIVGGHDADVVETNRRASMALRCEKRVDVLPGSTQRFEEPGALEAVAHHAGAWFAQHAPGHGAPRPPAHRS